MWVRLIRIEGSVNFPDRDSDPMSAMRRKTVSLLERKKMPRRNRIKFTAPKSSGAKRVSFLRGKRAPRRSRVSLVAKKPVEARRR